MSRFCDAIRYDPHAILGDLEKAAGYLKTILSAPTPYGENSITEQRHECGMPRQNPDQSIVGRRDHRIRRPVEDRLLRRNDGDVHQELAIFFAAATTSSMPPAM